MAIYYIDWKDQQASVQDPSTRFITNGTYKGFVTGDGRDMSGESFLYAPKYKMSAGGTYRWDGRLTFNADLTYQSTTPSEYQFDAAGQVTGELVLRYDR